MVLTPLLGVMLIGFQAKPDAFDFHAADVTIMQSKPVQKELKITEAQRTKMNTFAKRHEQTLATLEKKYGAKANAPAVAAKVRPELEKAFGLLKKDVLAALSATQLKRLREINLQRLGITALTDEKVATKVGLSSAQLKQYRDAYTAGANESAKLQQEAANPVLTKYQSVRPKSEAESKTLRAKFESEMQAAGVKVKPKLDAVEARTKKKLEGIMTPAQRAAFKALQGKPFKPA
ncbi:hypothetical protein MCEMSE15_00806 [Fimbriimonadaceae bacterium]